MAAKKLKIAVLDDYQRASEPYFARFKEDHEIVYFPDTLLPYNGADTPQSVKDALVKRLEPFNVISMQHIVNPAVSINAKIAQVL